VKVTETGKKNKLPFILGIVESLLMAERVQWFTA